MRTKTMSVLFIIVALALFLAASQPAIGSDEEEVLQVAMKWGKAFNSADFDGWSSLWWNSQKTTNFGPPKQMAFLTEGYDAIVSLLTTEFSNPKGTYVVSVHNPHVTMLEDNVAVLTMYQIFTINPPAVKEQRVEQHRVTFVVQKIGGKWLIVHAHGSMLPTE